MEEELVQRLEAAVETLATGPPPPATYRDLSDEPSTDTAISAFDDLVEKSIGSLSAASEKIGGKVMEATKILEEAFSVQKSLLIKAKKHQILVEYKNKDPIHVEWAKALKELYLPGLWDYVKGFYPFGPAWGPAGSVAVSASIPASSISKAPSVPAPPSPPPASLFTTETASQQPKEGMSAVFQEISSGKAVTAGLRKVTDDMKTKNRVDRASVVSSTEKEARTSSISSSKAGPPKLELQMGRKWAVENQIGNKNLVITDCDPKQSVYVFGCKDSVVQVKGKVNNTTIDKCLKMGIVFKDVVAACEIVNCNGVEVQCEGFAPTISIDNMAGCQLYLSRDTLEVSITTAKSSEINVLVPGASPDGDWVEHSLPQQFVHTFKDGQFVTSPVSHSGG